MHNFCELNLDGNPKITSKGFSTMVRQMDRGQFKKLDMHLPTIKNWNFVIISLNAARSYLKAKQLNCIIDNLLNLTIANLPSNSMSTEGIAMFARAYPLMDQLDIRFNGIGNYGALIIADCMTRLTILSLATNRISFDGIKAISYHLPQLKSLDIKENSIGDDGAACIARGLKLLLVLFIGIVSIEVADCDVGNQGLLTLGRNLIYLEWIHIDENPLDSIPLKTIARNTRRIRTLKLPEQLALEKSISMLKIINHNL